MESYTLGLHKDQETWVKTLRSFGLEGSTPLGLPWHVMAFLCAFGRILHFETPSPGAVGADIDLAAGSFPAGVYLVSLTGAEGTTLTGQLVVRR